MQSTLRHLSGLAFLAICAAAPTSGPATLAGESHQIANSVHEDTLLRPRDASSKEGTPIVLCPREDWKCMTWKFEPAGDDVRLVNYFTHKTLYPADDTTSAVTQHKAAKEPTAAEHWRFVPAGDGLYRIEHVASGKVLGVSESGDVVAEKWTDAAGQKWKLLVKPEKFTG